MFLFLSIIVLFGTAQAKFYTDCGSKLASVQNVAVSKCDEDAKECILKKNTNVTISIYFTPSQEVKSLETEVHGVIMNLPMPFPLSQPDACKNSGLTCPMQAGESASYKATLPILKSYPKVKVDVKWELKNENDEDVVCIMIPARIN